MNCAVIDVGSNSVRLMILVDGKSIYEETKTTRLGRQLTVDGRIGEEEMNLTIDVIDMFCKRARLAHAFKIYIFGTAAVRGASNGRVFAFSVYARIGERLQVLNGIEEAKIGFVGAVGGDLSPSIVLDVGGASCEIAVGTGGVVTSSQSLDIGAVKIFSKCGDDKDAVGKYIDEMLCDIRPIAETLSAYAIGGTSTSIAMLLSGGEKYDKEITHGFVICRDKLKNLTDKLFEMGQDGRNNLTSIKAERREIIAGGAMLLLKILEKLEINSIKASENDNLIGYYKVFVE
ncbi:MAG: hypothetical protein RR327_00525 [Clostridia bacterium]